MEIVTRLSPNQSDRLFPGDVRLIVCHTPEGSYQSALSTCLNPAADVSYHLLIKKDGSEATHIRAARERDLSDLKVPTDLNATLLALLAAPNIASRPHIVQLASTSPMKKRIVQNGLSHRRCMK